MNITEDLKIIYRAMAEEQAETLGVLLTDLVARAREGLDTPSAVLWAIKDAPDRLLQYALEHAPSPQLQDELRESMEGTAQHMSWIATCHNSDTVENFAVGWVFSLELPGDRVLYVG